MARMSAIDREPDEACIHRETEPTRSSGA